MESLKLTSDNPVAGPASSGTGTQGGRLQGKVAIVTGAGSGFGAAIAIRFAREGAKVLVGDINADGADKTAAACGGEGESAHVVTMDVTSREHWKEAVDECVRRWGKLDIVVNNAGTSYKNKPTLEVTEDEFDRVFEINVKSVFWSVGAAVPQMKKQSKGGAFINISSVGSTRPRPGLVWYNSTKAAISNASKALAAEYGPDQIRVNAICPLLSGTGLFENFVGVPYTEENVQKFLGNVPLGRLTDPNDVASTAVFLASDEGSFITGVEVPVDGGRSV